MRELRGRLSRMVERVADAFVEPPPRPSPRAPRPLLKSFKPLALARKALAVGLSAALLVAGWPFTFTVAPAFAAVPQLLNYQGKLGDGSGNPLSGTFSMRFQFFDAPSGGNLLFTETEDNSTSNPIAVANGIYTVTLGGVTAGGIPASAFYGSNVYLELSLNAGSTYNTPPAETLAPRERLVANGYALHSITVENLGAGVAIATFTAAGSLLVPYGIVASSGSFSGSLTASSATLTAVGSTQFSVATSSGINVTGGGVYAPFFSGVYYGDGSHLSGVTATGVSAPNVSAGQFGANVGGGNFSFPANVGIGTTSPAQALHLSTTTLIIDGNVAGLSVGVSTFVVAGGNVGIGTASPDNLLQIAGLVHFDNARTATSLGFQAGNVNAGANNLFAGYHAGNVNAGGASDTAAGNNALLSNTSGSQNTAVGDNALQNNQNGIGNTAVGYSAGTFNVSGSNNTSIGFGANNGSFGQSNSANTAVGTSAGQVLTTGSNNVLLGDFTGSVLNSGSGNVVIGHNANAVAGAGSSQVDIGNLLFGTGVSGTGAALSPGNVGVGTSSPAARLHVSSGTATLLIDGNAATPFQIGTSTMVVTGAGNVGIGTSSPVSPLHVNQGNQTNIASLNLSNLGAGASGIVMTPNAGGILQIGDNTAGPFQIIASNRPIVYTVNNGAFFMGSAAHTFVQGASTPARVVMSVQSSDPAQTGDLQEWQSNGVVLSSVTASGGFVSKYGLNAATATFTATGNTQFDIVASSGIQVTGTGGVTAAFFSGAFYGDGSHLSGVAAGSVNASGVTPGTFQNGPYTFQNTVNFTGALPNIVAGSSITTTGGFFGGGLGTAGTQRLDPAGNFVNVSNLTGTAGVTLQATGATLAHSATGANIQTFLTNGGERMRLDASGNLGIGTTNPAALLHVLGGAGSGLITDLPSNSNHLNFRVAGANKWTPYIFGNDLRFWDSTDRVALQAGGNVGVGTNFPATRLHVSSGTVLVDGNGTLPFQIGVSSFVVNGSGNVGIGTSNPANKLVVALGAGQIAQLNDGGSASAFWGTNIGLLSQGAQAQISAVSGAPLAFFTGGTLNTMTAGTERMRLDAVGNLGVGTTTAGARLSVQGSGNTSATATLNVTNSGATSGLFVRDDGRIGVGTTNPSQLVHLLTAVSNAITFQNTTAGLPFGLALRSPDRDWALDESYAGTPASPAGALSVADTTAGKARMVFDVTGNIGIGSARPAGLLHVSSGTLLLDGNASIPFQIGVSSFVVNSNGNVGVGVGNPAQLLQVGAGSFLTVTPGGNVGFSIASPGNKFVSWQTAGQIAQFNDAGATSSAFWGSGVGLLSTGNPATLAQITTAGAIPLAFDTGGTLNNFVAGTERMRLDINGNLGIGTTNPGTRLEVNGGIKMTTGSGGVLTFSNGSTQATAAAASQWTANGTSIFNANAGNVGIAVSSPAQLLDVNGISALGSTGGVYTSLVGGFGPTISFNGLYNGVSYLAGVAGFGALWQFVELNGNLTYFTGSSVGAGVAHVNTAQHIITSGGLVGLGTTSPTANYRLTVQQNAATGTIKLQSTQASGWSSVDFADSGGTTRGGTGWGNASVADYPNTMFMGTSGANTMQLATSNLGRLTIVSGGNIGIGIGAPLWPLHLVKINANALVLDDNTTGSGVTNNAVFRGLGFQYSSPNGEGAILASSPAGSSRLTFYTTNTTMGERMRIDANGNVGINTTTPVNALDVNGTVALGTYAGVNAASGSTSLIASGNVGIGLTNPAFPLEVGGFAAIGILFGRTLSQTANDDLFLGNTGQTFYLDRPGAGGQLILGYNTAKQAGQNDPLQVYNNSTDRQLMIEVRSAGTSSGANQVLLIPGILGNVGIGFAANPVERLMVNGAVQVGDDPAAACDVNHRGVTKILKSVSGVGDSYQACMKNARDTYFWVVVSSGDYTFPNGAGGFYNYSGVDAQGHALAACESVYGTGNCTAGGTCGSFTYYYKTGDASCSCPKPAGSYEFMYSNTGYVGVGDDYGGQTSDVSNNNSFVRRKGDNTCDANSWQLVLPSLGNAHPSLEGMVTKAGSATLTGPLTVTGTLSATNYQYSSPSTKYIQIAASECVHFWPASAGYSQSGEGFFAWLSDGSTANGCLFTFSPPNGSTLVGLQMGSFTGSGTTTCSIYAGTNNGGALVASVTDNTSGWKWTSETTFSHNVTTSNQAYAVKCTNGAVSSGNIALGAIRIRYTDTALQP